MGSVWMGMMKVFDGILGSCNVRYGFPTLPSDNLSSGQGIALCLVVVMSLE